MVTEFVGFVAAYRFPGGLDPAVAGVLGAPVTRGPRSRRASSGSSWAPPSWSACGATACLGSALAGVMASVVGVIASLALSFGAGVLFERTTTARPFAAPIQLPVWSTVDAFAVAIAVGAAVAIHRFRVNVVWVVAGRRRARLACARSYGRLPAMTLRDELDALPTRELHDRALAVAEAPDGRGLPLAADRGAPGRRGRVGDEQRSKVDVMRPLALINDLFDAGEGELGEALRPLYVDYLEEHGGIAPGRRGRRPPRPTSRSSRPRCGTSPTTAASSPSSSARPI